MDKLFLERFRMINEPIEIDIKPITILTGQNNSGKSSIIKSLLLLSDYMDQDQQLHLEYNGKFANKHKLTGFDNTHNWYNNLKSFKIGIKNKGHKIQFLFNGDSDDSGTLDFATIDRQDTDGISFKNHISQILVDANLNFFQKEKPEALKDSEYSNLLKSLKHQISHLQNELESNKDIQSKIIINENIIKSESKFKNLSKYIQKSESINSLNIHKSVIVDGPGKKEYFQLNLQNILRNAIQIYYEDLSNREYINSQTSARNLFEFSDSVKDVMSFNIDYLGPNRTIQSRLYMNDSHSQEISEICNEYVKYEPSNGTPAKQFLLKWLEKFKIGSDIRIKNHENAASSIEIKIEGKSDFINIADKGYGSGQLVTLLLKLTNIIHRNSHDNNYWKRRRVNTLVIIEEPEANLHPSFQSKLAELFYEVSKVHNIKFILETHSEYLIRKLQVLTAAEDIDPDQVAIYYLDQASNQNVVIKLISILPDGRLSSNFGKGFFDEAGNHSLELIKLGRKKSSI